VTSMPSAVSMVNEIRKAVGRIDTTTLDKLRKSKGYAFEALALTMVGDELSRLGWLWVHPGSRPTFCFSNGGKLADRVASYSHVRRSSDGRLLLQGISQPGKSTADHDLDLVVLTAQGGWLGAIECKNWSSTVPPSIGREAVGLACDLRPPHRSNGWRELVGVVSAGPTSSTATKIMGQWGVTSYSHADSTSGCWADIAGRIDAL
jgi:hypothetical protein